MSDDARRSPPDHATVRACFPALGAPGPTSSGVPETLFLDAAGGSPTPAIVAARIAEYLTTDNMQLGGHSPASLASARIVEDARRWLATWLGADPETHTVIIGASASTLCATLAEGMARRGVIDRRDEIVIGRAGHESNIGPWLRLAAAGFTIRWWEMDRGTGASDLAELRTLVTERTAAVAIHHVSNLTGEIEDLDAIVAIAHDAGAAVIADGVAYAPHRAMDVSAWGVDAYAFSLYKVFGPELAAMAVRRDFLKSLVPPNHDFVDHDGGPYAFELGGASRMGCAGALAVGEYLAFVAGEPGAGGLADLGAVRDLPPRPSPPGRSVVERAFERIEAWESPLTARVLADLSGRRGVRVIGAASPSATRLPTISFVMEGRSSAEFARAAGEAGLGVRAGHFYAARAAERFGLGESDGAVRISLTHVNDERELERWERFLEG